jgi:tRNA nucleotidyltransferase (CCA-adding enzyme)
MFELFEVGGCVRDELLGIPSKDVDFVAVSTCGNDLTIENTFAQLESFLTEQGFTIFLSTPKFFTIRAKVPNGNILKTRTDVADFVLARKDGPSSDGRRPDFVLPGTLIDDLTRRDFTVNAMARDSGGNLIDPFRGQDDLNNRVLNFVGDPMERIREDGLRVMRALRFNVTKNINLSTTTKSALQSDLATEMLMKVSIERIREELEKMFTRNTVNTIDILLNQFPGLVPAIFRDGLRLMPTLKH